MVEIKGRIDSRTSKKEKHYNDRKKNDKALLYTSLHRKLKL
jgi:hypothetical protein